MKANKKQEALENLNLPEIEVEIGDERARLVEPKPRAVGLVAGEGREDRESGGGGGGGEMR